MNMYHSFGASARTVVGSREVPLLASKTLTFPGNTTPRYREFLNHETS